MTKSQKKLNKDVLKIANMFPVDIETKKKIYKTVMATMYNNSDMSKADILNLYDTADSRLG